MKAYQHELAHHYQQRQNVFRFASASLFQSLITAAVIGIVVAFIGVALNAVRWQGNTSWYVSATTGAVVEMVVVTALVTMVIEGRRKRAIRGRRRRRVKFHQSLPPNSSGSYYNHAENGLIAVDAMHTLELLREAKDILFPTMSAPVDTEMR